METVTITEEKLKASEMVEVIVETEAQAGISGISITGGGKDGLFISEVLKDSPAAKNLPVLEGDQIVSARVYFENIKYEDALKILQYAEKYKVSYCLKRTVQSSDVTVSSSSGSVEVKGPKAKMPKMTVKSLTPVKKKKKKVPSQLKDSDVSMKATKGSDISVASMDIPPVDVEFSFPKFSKFLKTKGVAETTHITKSTEATAKEPDAGQKRLKMKFPRLRVKEAAAGGIFMDISESKAASEKSRAEVEVKDKTKLGISVPEIMKPIVDVIATKPEISVSVPKVVTETKEEKVFKTPQVELDISLPTIKGDAQDISESAKTTGLSTSIKIPDVEIKVPTTSIEVEAPGAKVSMPQISKVGICTPKVEKETDIAVHGKQKSEIKLPSVEIVAPKLDVDLNLPKIEGAVEVEPPDTTGQGFQIKLPKFSLFTKTADVTPPEVKKDIKREVSEDKFKMPSIKGPQVGISIPKGKLEVEGFAGKEKCTLTMPSLDISAPKLDIDLTVPKMESGDITVEPIEIPDVTLKMPKVSPPKVGMKVKDAYAKVQPQVDVKAEKTEIETSADVTLKMPKVELPKLDLKSETAEVQAGWAIGKAKGEEIKVKGPKIKLPSFGLLSSKEKSEKESPVTEPSKEVDWKSKFPTIKMPSVDISLPKVQDIETGKLEVTMPSTMVDIKPLELEGIEVPDLKFKMPKVSLPKLDVSARPEVSPPKIGIHMPSIDTKIKGDDKKTVTELDISVPKVKPVEFGITSPKSDVGISMDKPKVALKLPKFESDAIAFDGETGDSKICLPSIKIPSLELDAPRLDVDLNLPKVKAETVEPIIEEADTRFQMPKINLPKLSDVARDMDIELDVPKITGGDLSFPHIAAGVKGPELEVEDQGVKINLPKVGIGLGKPTSIDLIGSGLKGKVDVKLPDVKIEKPDIEAKIKMPSVKLPSVAITAPKIPDVDIEAEVPKVGVELSSKEDLTASESDVKWKAPKFSLRKLGIAGPKFKKGGEAEVKIPDTEGDAEIAVKGPKVKMPKFSMIFPKSKQDVESDIDVKASKGKKDVSIAQEDTSFEGKVKLPSIKLPTVDVSAPKLDVDIEVPKGHTSTIISDKATEIDIDIPDVKLNLPKFSLPKFGKGKIGEEAEMEKIKAGGKVSPSKSAKAADLSLGEGGIEAKGKGRELKMKLPTIKMPSFGISKKDVDAPEAELELSIPGDKTKILKTGAQEAKVSIETQDGDEKTTFMKMPTFKLPSAKMRAPEVDLTVKGSKESLQPPDLHVKVPQVTLPSLGMKGDRAVEVTLPKSEAKGLDVLEVAVSEKLKMPSLEISTPPDMPAVHISVPCVKPDICTSLPKAEVDVSDADIKQYEGDLTIPILPSFDVSMPSLELDIGLSKASVDTTVKNDLSLEKTAKLKMPKVEFPKLGELEAKVDSATKSKTVESEAKLKMPKIKMPHFDISLPKVKLGEEDIPFMEGEMNIHGTSSEKSITEGTFSLPSVELPKMSSPKIRAPELELDISLGKDDVRVGELSRTPKVEISGREGEQHDLKLKMPKIKLPKFGGFSSGAEEHAPKADVKVSKTEESIDSGIMSFKIKMPKLQMGSLKAKGGEDLEKKGDQGKAMKSDVKAQDHEDSENERTFRIKMPSFGISKDHADVGTEPLHPSEEELKFKMPKISVPDVGFSGGEGEGALKSSESGQASMFDKIKSRKSSSLENLEIDVGLNMPKLKIPSIGLSGRNGDDMHVSLDENLEGKKSLFKLPDVEISAPKINAHAEYEVEGAKLEHRLLKDVEFVELSKKTANTKEEHKHKGTTEEETEKKYKIKLPNFEVGLPKPVSGDVELSAPKLTLEVKEPEIDTDQHESRKTKKNIFSIGKSKDKNTSLLSSEVDTSLDSEGPEMKIKLPKIKMKPSFGRSRGKGKDAEVNGEFDTSTRTDGDNDLSPDGTTKSSKIKFPKLGFASSKTHSGDASVNGASSPGHINGENEVSVQNGSQDGGMKIGKLKFPKVEFSSPYKGKEIDSDLNLKLVKTEEPDSKDDSNESSFSSKFKSPKFTLSGFKKKEKGEDHLVSSSARTEMATVENIGEGDSKSGKGRISLGFFSSKSKGEYTVDNSGIGKDTEGGNGKSTKYKIPEVSLSTSEVETTTEMQKTTEEGPQDVLKITLPQVGFTTHQDEIVTTEEETSLGFLKITTTKQIKTETVTEKTLAI